MTTAYAYDLLGRITRGIRTGSEDISYAYDSNNNRKEMKMGNKTTAYRYLEIGFSVGSQTNFSPEFVEDYSLGGIKYSELYRMVEELDLDKQFIIK